MHDRHYAWYALFMHNHYAWYALFMHNHYAWYALFMHNHYAWYALSMIDIVHDRHNSIHLLQSKIA